MAGLDSQQDFCLFLTYFIHVSLKKMNIDLTVKRNDATPESKVFHA
jgi:hypothetical protein